MYNNKYVDSHAGNFILKNKLRFIHSLFEIKNGARLNSIHIEVESFSGREETEIHHIILKG